MGAGGRPPKPTQLKVLQGNPGKRPLNQAEPVFACEHLTCPRWLTAQAKREWRRILKAMPDRLATEGDRAALAAYCQAWARWQEAEEAISAGGLTQTVPIVNKKGDVVGEKRVANPAVVIAQRYYQLMLAAAGRFGLDPSSRSKIRLPDKADEDPFAAFLQASGQKKAADG